MAKTLISDKEIYNIVEYGKSQGWGQQKVLDCIGQVDYEAKVAAEKARVAKENARLEAEARAKWEKETKMIMHTIDNNAILEFNKKGTDEQTELLNKHNEYMKSRDESYEYISLDEYKDVLKESRIDMTEKVEDLFSKISESSATFEANKGVKKFIGGIRDQGTTIKGQLFDYGDQNFIVNTLQRTYGKMGFTFRVREDDVIDVQYTDSNGETHTSADFGTNFVNATWAQRLVSGQSEYAEEISAEKMEAWMTEVYTKDHMKGTDYRVIDGEWHYTDGHDSLGVVESGVLLKMLEKKSPEGKNIHKDKTFKWNEEGILMVKELFAGENDWEVVEDEELIVDLETLYPQAKQNALDIKEGTETAHLRHSVVKLDKIEERKVTTVEYERRKNTSLKDFYDNDFAAMQNEKLGDGAFDQNMINDWKRWKEKAYYEEIKGDYSKENFREEYEAWIEEAKVAIPQKDFTDGDITTPLVYEFDEENGDYKITEEEVERLADLNIIPAENQLTISKEDYNQKVSLHNRLLASTDTKDIEAFHGRGEGKTAISKLVKIAERDGVLETEESREKGLAVGEYTYNGEIINVTEEDVIDFNKWKTHYNNHSTNIASNETKYKQIDADYLKYENRNLIAQNIRFNNEIEELNNPETTDERKIEIKKHIKSNQSNWSKFYSISDFEGMDIDIAALERFVTKQMEDDEGMLKTAQLEALTYGYNDRNIVNNAVKYSNAVAITNQGDGNYGHAELEWDESRGKYYWNSKGAGEWDATEDIEELYEIDKIKAQVFQAFIGDQLEKQNKEVEMYERAGMFKMMNTMSNYSGTLAKLDRQYYDAEVEYKTLLDGFKSGDIEKNDENVKKVNDLITQTEVYSSAMNSTVDLYNLMSNNERNQVFIENYNDLVDRNAKTKQNWNALIDPTSTNLLNRVAKQNFDYELRRQERLEKAEAGHVGWQLMGIGESVYQSFMSFVTGTLGVIESQTPRIWGGNTAEDRMKIVNSWNIAQKNLTFDFVGEGDMIDPETGEVDWTNVAPTVAVVVTDMYNMMKGGFLAKGAMKGIGKAGKWAAKTSARTVGISSTLLPKTYTRISKVKNFIGTQATKAKLLDRASQMVGGANVMFPKNVQEAIHQIDDDFTAEDAMRSATTKTFYESLIETINPDINMFKGMSRFKKSKGYGTAPLWENGTNLRKGFNLFRNSIKEIPKELLEENLQEFANAYWNNRYNERNKTNFHVATQQDFKALNILTPLSIITSGFIRTRGFRKGKPDFSMYQAAAEDIIGFNAEMKKNVDLYEQDKADGVPPKKRRGIDQTEYKRIMSEVNTWTAMKNKIDPDHYQNMTNQERMDTLGLLYTKEKLQKKIKEEKDSNKKEELKKDLKNVELDIQKVANTVESGFSSRQEKIMDLEILGLKLQWKNAELGSQNKKDILKKIRKKTKERNELREKSSLYEFNGKHYNNTVDFIEAIKTAKKNGYFKNWKNRPRIRISNKVEAARAEHLIGMINSLTGSTSFNSGEVLMSNEIVQEVAEFVNNPSNQGKTEQDFRDELVEEEKKNNPDASRLNDLRNAIKYSELVERGYEQSNIGRGMVMRGRENQALLKLEEQKIEDKIAAIREITNEAGVDVGVFSQDQIIDYHNSVDPRTGKRIIPDAGAINANAFIHEYMDDNGNEKRMIVINKTVALKNSALTSPSHELLHMVLFSVLNGPKRTVKGPDGVFHEVYITEKGVKLIKGFLDLLPADHKKKLEKVLEDNGYKHGSNKDGSINKDAPLPFESYAEEYLTHYHDLVVNEKDPSKRISLTSPDTRSVLKKIGDYFTSFWKQEVEEDLNDLMDTHLDTPKKVLDFMNNFNQQAIKNDFGNKLVDLAVSGAKHYEDLVGKEKTKPPTAQDPNYAEYAIPIKSRPKTAKESIKTQTGIEAKAGEKTVEKLVQKGIKEGLTAEEIGEKIFPRFGWHDSEIYQVQQFIKGKLDGTITSDFATWRLPPKKTKTTSTQYSKTEAEVDKEITQKEREDLAKETNDTWSDPNLTIDEKAFTIAQKYGGMAVTRINVAKNNAIGDTRDIFDLYRDDMISEITYDPGDPDLKSRNVLGLVKDYPAYVAKQEAAGLDVAPLSGFINTWFKVRAYEVFAKHTKDKGFKKSMDDAINEISKMEAEETEKKKDKAIKSGQILVSERIITDDPYNKGKIDRVNKYNEGIANIVKENPSVYEGKDYKTLTDLDPRGTIGTMMFDPSAVYTDDGTPFWQSPKGKKLVGTSILESIVNKLANNDNLNQQDIKALQPFISKHNQLLWTSLPQGFMTDKNNRPTTATGVQKVLLAPFYNKGRRAKNLWPQRKKTNMPDNFLETFGITKSGEVNIVGKESNVSQRVKALISQHGKIMTNQQVRKTLFEGGADPDVIGRIANGKSILVYSKSPQQGDVNPETDKIEPGFGNRENQRVEELIQMYHNDPGSYDAMRELDPLFVGVVEDYFININSNLQRGRNYIPSIMLDKYTPKDFIKKNFGVASYNGDAPQMFDGKNPGDYQAKYVKQAMELGLTIHPDFDFKTLSYLLGFKDGKSINPKLYGLELSKIENREFTPEERLAEEEFMKEHLGKDAPKIIKGLVPMIMSTTEIKNMINDISTQKGLKAKLAKKAEYRSKIIAMNKANMMAMKYISLKMKQAYNDSNIISPHFVYFIGQMQTNIIEGTRALSTFEFMYLIEGQQVPLIKDKRGNIKVYPKPDRSKIGFNLTKQFLQEEFGEDFKIIKPTQKDIGEVLIVADQVKLENVEYYASQEWKNYIKAWKKVDEWKERYEANKNKLEKDLKSSDVKKKTKAENDVEKAGSKKAAIEVMTISDLTWKNEHVGASATTHAERSSYVWSNGKSIDLANLGHDHRSAWVPKYLANEYFDAKIKIGGKEVDNKVSYEGPMRMTKFGKGKSKNIYHAETGVDLATYLAEAENISGIVQGIRELSDLGHKQHKTVQKATQYSKTVNPAKGISIWDFDDTLATTKSNVLFTTPDGTIGKLNAEEYASQYIDLAAKGYVFDFSEFNLVVDGKIGPFFKKFQDRIEKFGIQDNFILTARPMEAAPAIREFLLSQGIDIPLENITGLGNSTGEAKAMWIVEKVADGYNDIYFADDALANVQAVKNVLDQFDVKGKVQQAKTQFSKSIDPTINDILDSNTQSELDLNRILEQTKGVKAEKVFSDAQAKIRGSKKGRWKFWVPPSAEDFKGLIYRFVGKGRQGEAQMAFFKKALFDPFSRAYEAMNASKQGLDNQYKTLLKEFKSVKKDLKNKISTFEGYDSDFTVQQAIRVYLWNKNGMEVPGLSQRDLKTLVDFVESQNDIKAFADNLGLITNQEQGYLEPSEYWMVENIQSDINKINNEINREEHLAEWRQNKEIMFGVWGPDGRLIGNNINKIEAIYGTRFREALEDMLWRMEFGTKREAGTNRLVNAFNNWANQSVGAIMFLNMRSALLQTISSINYLNWSDNNPLKAGAALLNFPQFIKDFTMIFNSNMLKQRRAGNQRGINEAELAEAVAGSKNTPKAILNWLLTKGFLPTQIADSFAISSGGATFYRNRVNSYLKQGMDQKAAEEKAWSDFQENTEESQQSARPDMISQQQASPLGRYILAFKNTPMQYARLTKKAFLDLRHGRGDVKTNVGKIMYYMAVQNLIFSALQAALGALIGSGDDDEDETKKSVLNSMLDSILGGIGFGGNVVATLKNTIMEYIEQEKKGPWVADHTYTILKFFSLSPTVSSKGRKIYSAIQEYKFNREVIDEMSMLNIDNPRWSIIANIISGTTNLPLDRVVKKVDNVDAALTENITALERLALLMGWNTWDLDIDDSDVLAVEDEIKEKKTKEKKTKEKKKEKIKKEEKEEKLENKNLEIQKKEKKEGKKDIKCAAVSKSGKRCKTTVESGSSYCTVHIKVEQGTKEVQCKKIKSDKKRCKMKTKAKSGLCYYHD